MLKSTDRLAGEIGAPVKAQQVLLPEEIEERLENGAHLVISVSGGKDSDVMALTLAKLHKARGWQGQLVMVHSDLGRMEWKESLPHCYNLAEKIDARLAVVRKTRKVKRTNKDGETVTTERQYDLLMGFRQRMYKLMDEDGNVTSPHWASSAARYCTSDWKRAPIDKWIRNTWKRDDDVVIAIGLRRDESSARAKKPCMRERKGASAPTKNRNVFDWHPILHYTMEDIEAVCEEFDWELHVAYNLGNERLSCQMCVLACEGDIKNGVYNNPKLYRQLVAQEVRSGYTYQQNRPLWRVAPELLTDALLEKARQLDPEWFAERREKMEAEFMEEAS